MKITSLLRVGVAGPEPVFDPLGSLSWATLGRLARGYFRRLGERNVLTGGPDVPDRQRLVVHASHMRRASA